MLGTLVYNRSIALLNFLTLLINVTPLGVRNFFLFRQRRQFKCKLPQMFVLLSLESCPE